jgi:beta-glucosidase
VLTIHNESLQNDKGFTFASVIICPTDMRLQFPPDFIFGTSTSAGQIETAFQHNWAGLKSADGFVFNDTTRHEQRYAEDIDIISSVAPHYRMSLMWSRLQRQPYAEFDPDTKNEYHKLLKGLKAKGVTVMMVMDHWVHPLWFSKAGGWSGKDSVSLWLDYAKKLVIEYGEYVSIWNTFNEPNLFITFSYLLGGFPPFTKNLMKALAGIRNMGRAHESIYDFIKVFSKTSMVGISHNCVYFSAENIAGVFPSIIAKWWYQHYLTSFFSKSDYIGISYYARLSFDPFPVTQIFTPAKIKKWGKVSDDIWEYYPQGLADSVRHFWQRTGKPVIITENGICTSNDSLRVKAIQDYMAVIHGLLKEKIDIIGYYHWSTWDNFEWTLGPTYRFGLYECNPVTKGRQKKPSADVYRQLAFHKELEV